MTDRIATTLVAITELPDAAARAAGRAQGHPRALRRPAVIPEGAWFAKTTVSPWVDNVAQDVLVGILADGWTNAGGDDRVACDLSAPHGVLEDTGHRIEFDDDIEPELSLVALVDRVAVTRPEVPSPAHRTSHRPRVLDAEQHDALTRALRDCA